jgi:LmbE family N-acetylglucosaminyl deacetylase
MKRIVSVGAHPDDVEQGMGGTLAKHSHMGDEVHIIVCTLGIGGSCGDQKMRKDEAVSAAGILGGHLHSLDYPVLKLNNSSTEFDRIMRKAIDDINPDRVYTHSPFDYHQVHFTVSESVTRATKNIEQVLFYEDISSTTSDFRPNAYVDITKHIDLKLKSIDMHRTQSNRLYLQSNIMKSLAYTRYSMGKIGSNPNGMAEAFTIHRFIIGGQAFS